MKDIILLGDKLAATYKGIWPDVMNGKVHYGYTSPKKFQTPSGEETDQLTGRTKVQGYLPLAEGCPGNSRKFKH